MEEELRNRFIESVESNSHLLTEGFGFADRGLKNLERTEILHRSFTGKYMAFEFLADMRDQDISCKISLLEGGELTKHYSRSPDGRLVRDDFTAFLRRNGVRERLLTKVGGKSFYEQIPVTVKDYFDAMVKFKNLWHDSAEMIL